MQKKIKKLTATIILAILFVIKLLPMVVYAKANEKDNPNIKFSVVANEIAEKKIRIGEIGNIALNIDVFKAGYLKDIEVELENPNFKIGDFENNRIKKIDGNKIYFNTISLEENVKINIPIEFLEKDFYEEDYFSRENKFVLRAKYINELGKEIEIEKKHDLNIAWKYSDIFEIEQKLVRNKDLSSGIRVISVDFELKSKNIIKQVNFDFEPGNESKNLQKILITGENINFSSENNIVKLNINNLVDSKIKNKENEKFTLNIFYNNEFTNDNLNIKTNAEVEFIDGTKKIVNENKNFNLTKKFGDLVRVQVESDSKVEKGFLYTNKEKLINQKYLVDTPNVNEIDNIKIIEEESNFDGKKVGITTKRIYMDKDNFFKTLGENGFVKIYSNGNQIAELKRNEESKEINSVIDYILISKPISENKLEINYEKDIQKNLENSIRLKKFETKIKIEAYKNLENIEDETIRVTGELVEPKTSAEINVGNNLSAISENRNFNIDIKLKNIEEKNALYKNPIVTVEFPNEVENININSIEIFQANNLEISHYEVKKKIIKIYLKGIQTDYISNIYAGTLIKINSNILINKVATNDVKQVKVKIFNELLNEEIEILDNVNIISKMGFIVKSEMKYGSNSVEVFENEKNDMEIPIDSNNRRVKFSYNIINNFGRDVENLMIYGNNLSSESNLKFEIIDVKVSDGINVLYSRNEREKNISSYNNWIEGAKSFALSKSLLKKQEKINVEYEIEIKEEIKYDLIYDTNLEINYSNNSNYGNNTSKIETKKLLLHTKKEPKLAFEIYAKNKNNGSILLTDSNVREGDQLYLVAKVANNSSEKIKNIKLELKLPDGLTLLEKVVSNNDDPTMNLRNDEKKTIEFFIDEIDSKNIREESFLVEVTQIISEIEGMSDFNDKRKLGVEFKISGENIDEETTTFNVINNVGDLNAELSTNIIIEDNIVEKGQNIKISMIVTNPNYKEKNNVKAKLQLPKGLEYVGNNSSLNYDKKDNAIYTIIDKINGDTKSIIAYDVRVNELNKTEEIFGTVSADNVKEISTERIYLNPSTNVNNEISVELTKNVNGEILDNEYVEYNYIIRNNSKIDKLLKISDVFPKDFTLRSFKLEVDGNQIKYIESGYINLDFVLPKNKVANAKIMVSPKKLDAGNVQNYKTTGKIFDKLKGKEYFSNEVSVDIRSSSNKSENIGSNNGITEKFSISGVSYKDNNFNEVLDGNDELMQNIKYELFDAITGENTGKYAISDNLGNYKIVDINKGKYIVKSTYNNKTYNLSNYGKNNSFIETVVNGKKIALSQIIDLDKTSRYDVNLCITENNTFDLKLDQGITRVTSTNSLDNKVKNNEYDFKKITKIDTISKDVEYTTVLVEFSIRITNEGKIPGYANSIVDYIPKGLSFNAELNPDWYIGKDGLAYNDSLTNVEIHPGETKEIKIVLLKKLTADNTGVFKNIAEIQSHYNQYGFEDINSIPGNRNDDENDISSAEIAILVQTGGEMTRNILFISISIISIIGIIALQMRKHFKNKMFRNIL